MRLHFVWIGKTKDRRCAGLVDDYLGRIERFAPYEVSEVRAQASGDERRVVVTEGLRLIEAIEGDDFVVLLDEGGREMTSRELAVFVDERRISGVKRLGLVIGGFAGVSDELKKRAQVKFCLSRLTLTHELARVVLVEQIYRAFTLLGGLPYHR